MARLWRGIGGAIAIGVGWLLAAYANPAATAADLYKQPVLIVDPGMHTAPIWAAAADAAGRIAATGSEDKTVRIWSLADGKLLRTIRVPAGPGNVGKVRAIAVSPDGKVVAAGGWFERNIGSPIYLFDPSTGKMFKRIDDDLPADAKRLAFSPDGRLLAVGLSHGGLRVFDRDKNWSEAFRDTGYGTEVYGAAFAGDERLAVSSYDGKIRLYDSNFELMIAPWKTPAGHIPRGLAFNPNGDVLAVGYHDTPSVELLDGHTLRPLSSPDTNGLVGQNLDQVAWSADGLTLFAGGIAGTHPGAVPVLAWDGAGHGPRRILANCGPAATSILNLVPLPANRFLVARGVPCIALQALNGSVVWTHLPFGADFRNQGNTFAVSDNGEIVDIGFELFGKSPLRFDVKSLNLLDTHPSDNVTRLSKHDGLPVKSWNSSYSPTLAGKPIELQSWEVSESLAIHPDGHRFVLGTSFALRAFDAAGTPLWDRPMPGTAWAVNISGDGRLVVAALGDGTVRWYRMDQGSELLALYVLSDKKNWVAWTPEGFYAATPGAYGVLRWQINRGIAAAADTVPVSDIPKLNRPDAVRLVLQELETVKALGIADLAAARQDVQAVTGSATAPGARLHVLAIGISDYGNAAKQLNLKFADKDAVDVANALMNTQSSEYNKIGGLYADVLPQYLTNDKASRDGIFNAFAAVRTNMANDAAGQDLAVILFSGHGAVADGEFYLLPYGVHVGTPAELEASAISIGDFRKQVENLAHYGRVLLLLDACHSGAVTADGSNVAPNADLLRAALTMSNVTVLTSSTATERSHEDETWNNGAFTKVVLESLGKDADENHDGVISMSEMTAYIAKHVPMLTHNQQHPEVEQHFQSSLFVAGL